MATVDRFAGPLASAWPDVGAAWLERLLLPPELALPVPSAPQRGAWAEPHVPGPTFGPDRYGKWAMRSTWHDVPHVRATGQAFAARDVTHAAPDTRAGAAMEIAAAYQPGPAALVAHRPAGTAPQASRGRRRPGTRSGHRAAADPRPPARRRPGAPRLHRRAIDVTAFGPAGEFVLTPEELAPHEAFLGGAP
ncbi:hypothetical protein [Plantactinospora sp. WMMB782]|uniref:hypothetical protein n=1 Tax=Plantactinospora sp. WMMB782 TaxID=3404121 RepID=UPI003B94711D